VTEPKAPRPLSGRPTARAPLAYKYCSQHQQQKGRRGRIFGTREGSFETERGRKFEMKIATVRG